MDTTQTLEWLRDRWLGENRVPWEAAGGLERVAVTLITRSTMTLGPDDPITVEHNYTGYAVGGSRYANGRETIAVIVKTGPRSYLHTPVFIDEVFFANVHQYGFPGKGVK